MDLMGKYRKAHQMKAYVAGSDKIFVQLLEWKNERILVFDQYGHIRCDDDFEEET